MPSWPWLLAAVVVATTLIAPVSKWASKLAESRWASNLAARGRSWLKSRRYLLLGYAALVVVGLILALVLGLVWGLPALLTQHPHIIQAADRHKAITDTRTGLIAILAAVGAGVGIAYTARTYRLSREGQITDRYGKAVEQLGHDKIEVQLGGIYALERLMKASPADQPTITETLTAYVREHASATLPTVHTSRGKRVAGARRPPQVSLHTQPTEDVQAVLTVLGRRRPTSRETHSTSPRPTSPAPTSSRQTSPRPTSRGPTSPAP